MIVFKTEMRRVPLPSALRRDLRPPERREAIFTTRLQAQEACDLLSTYLRVGYDRRDPLWRIEVEMTDTWEEGRVLSDDDLKLAGRHLMEQAMETDPLGLLAPELGMAH